MKKILFAAGIVTLGISGVYAQDAKPAFTPQNNASSTVVSQPISRKMDPAIMTKMQAARLQRELQLTPEQTEQLKPILQTAQAEQGKAAMNNPETAKKIKAILTPDQIKKFDDLKAQREAAMKAKQEQIQKTPNQ